MNDEKNGDWERKEKKTRKNFAAELFCFKVFFLPGVLTIFKDKNKVFLIWSLKSGETPFCIACAAAESACLALFTHYQQKHFFPHDKASAGVAVDGTMPLCSCKK